MKRVFTVYSFLVKGFNVGFKGFNVVLVNREKREDTFFNPLMPGGNKKVTDTWINLQLSAAGLFKYVWPFCYHQALKG